MKKLIVILTLFINSITTMSQSSTWTKYEIDTSELVTDIDSMKHDESQQPEIESDVNNIQDNTNEGLIIFIVTTNSKGQVEIYYVSYRSVTQQQYDIAKVEILNAQLKPNTKHQYIIQFYE